jgi:hypothetical protein
LAKDRGCVSQPKLDTHFIDQFAWLPDIRCGRLRCRGLPHEIERQAGGGRYAQAHDPPLRLSGDRSLLLIPA